MKSLTEKFKDQDVAFDIECFPNFFLVVFQSDKHWEELRAYKDTPMKAAESIKTILYACRTLIGFNSLSYDIPMILRAMTGATVEELYEFSNRIIGNKFVDIQTREAVQAFGEIVNHVDVMASVTGFVSLKLCSARLHCQTIEDLPYPSDTELNKAQMEHVTTYCHQDCANTLACYHFAQPIIETKRTLQSVYDLDCVNMHNAMICEKIVCKETGIRPQKGENSEYEPEFQYTAPDTLIFNNRYLRRHKEGYESAVFRVRDTTKRQVATDSYYFKQNSIPMFGVDWNIGIGGIHTDDKRGSIDVRRDNIRILNLDVGSYYPTLILNQKLGPEHDRKRELFLNAFQSIYDRRMKAKADGDKGVANALKIPLNAVSGKLNNKYSVVYSPESYITMTLTGQLLIIRLAEMMFEQGARIYSANTDSLIIVIEDTPAMYQKVSLAATYWQQEHRCLLDIEEFKAVYSRDVNNYFALLMHEHEKVKRKGIFSLVGGDGHWPNNPRARVCTEAVIKAAEAGGDAGQTISQHIFGDQNIDNFFFVGSATKGVRYMGGRVGKVFRFVWTTNGVPLYRDTEQEYKIPESDGCELVMDKSKADDIFERIDYDRYIQRAEKILIDCGGEL